MELIQNENYDIKGYHKKLTFDNKGDLILVEYYSTYEEGIYSDIKVRETRTYSRNPSTLLLEKRVMIIDFLNEVDGEITTGATKTTNKYYDVKSGYALNKVARQNIIDKASMYLLSVVGLTNGKAFFHLLKMK